MSKCVQIRWFDGPAAGYADYFPLEDFNRDARGAERVHLVIGPRGGRHHARCRVTVTGKAARLDYSAFAEFNERHGMDVGVMKLVFADGGRTTVTAIEWNGEVLDADYASASVAESKLALAEAEERDREYGLFQRALRPAQASLYAELERTYGGRCAISGCPVPFALEAAHLTPVSDHGADTASNAVLLRADLHALLDSNHLAISPTTREVFLSVEAQSWKEYQKPHAGVRLASPVAGFEANAPSNDALRRRWEAFVDEHGDP